MGSTVLLVQVLAFTVLAVACSNRPEATPEPVKKPADAQHAGITTPHGDHSPHHGGIVLMNGDVHYEVVFDKGGKHRVWFSDAVREDLPASVASNVKMIVTRSFASPEFLTLTIDDSGESWVANGKPIAGGEMATISYLLHGEPYEIEIPLAKRD